MSDTYEPPKVWEWKQNSNQAFANINRPTAGAQQEKELPIGKHPLAALFPRHAQWRQSHHHAGGIACERA